MENHWQNQRCRLKETSKFKVISSFLFTLFFINCVFVATQDGGFFLYFFIYNIIFCCCNLNSLSLIFFSLYFAVVFLIIYIHLLKFNYNIEYSKYVLLYWSCVDCIDKRINKLERSPVWYFIEFLIETDYKF